VRKEENKRGGGVRREDRRDEKERKIQRKKTPAGHFAFSKKYYSLLERREIK
jgi:hypothetical protein